MQAPTDVAGIIQSAPPGLNPYAYAAELVVGAFAAINLLSTIASFVVLWRKSRSGSGIGFWFFKSQYGHASGIPYIMPNALTMYLFWNTVFMLFMQPFIWSTYISNHALNIPVIISTQFWFGTAYIWDGIGIWLSASGTLYTVILPRLLDLTSSKHRITNALLHPISLNGSCFIPPTILLATQLTTSILSVVAWGNTVHSYYDLIDVLVNLAGQWATDHNNDVDEALRQRAIAAGPSLMKQKIIAQAAYQRNAGTCKDNLSLPFNKPATQAHKGSPHRRLRSEL
ncbi:hypothetical protein FRC07_011892 [Ceratobasidium sp. 392]|nr:hypothetical protein FRC07_011892 [Ceratobasidium sp. 392]